MPGMSSTSTSVAPVRMIALLIALLLAPLAIGQESVSEPRGRPVDVGPAGDALGRYGRRHALVIGINDFQDSAYPTLAYAEADAQGVARMLIDHLGFEPGNVRLILGKDATREVLESALMDWACDPARIGEQDLMVIFFAGHGVTRDLGPRGPRGYIVPMDGGSDQRGGHVWSSLLGMRDLEDISEAIPAKHVLFILDCCFGGLAIRRSAPPVAAGLTSRARQVLTAGTGDQTVLDGGGGGHSIFTAAVIGGVRGSADLDGDQVVTFGELFNYVGRTVENKTSSRQTPLQATLPDHEGGSVALFKPGVQPGEATIADRLRSLERTTEQQLRELEQLSDALVVLELLQAEERLWPRSLEKVAAFRDWLGRARDVVSRLAAHEDFRERVRQETYVRQVLAGLVQEGEGTEPIWEQADPLLRWKFQTLGNLVSGLHRLKERIQDVEARLEFTLSLKDRSILDFAAEWDRVIEDVAGDPAFDRMRLEPQLGLAPVGRDPDSGLWEFWHLGSGRRPERHDGRLTLDEESGMVFVLLPGGTFRMGAVPTEPAGPGEEWNLDPFARPQESPVHSVTLDPFFISKYEMTQGQWERVMRENPSEFGPGQTHGGHRHTLVHPVENISWELCREALGRLGLDLPTEAQWEYGARAGTNTPWWTGAGVRSLLGKVNLADRSTVRAGLKWEHAGVFPELDDGYVYHAPVDSFEPNAFGLHNVLGNVWEWTGDRLGDYGSPLAPGDGNRLDSTSTQRVLRGGCFRYDPTWARCAVRHDVNQEARDNSVGLRPARAVAW